MMAPSTTSAVSASAAAATVASASVNHDWDQEEYDILAEVLFDPEIESSFAPVHETSVPSTAAASGVAPSSTATRSFAAPSSTTSNQHKSSMEIQNAKLASGSTVLTGSLTMMPDNDHHHHQQQKQGAPSTKRPATKPASPRSVVQTASPAFSASSVIAVPTKKQKVHTSLPPRITKTTVVPPKTNAVHSKQQQQKQRQGAAPVAVSSSNGAGVKPHPRSKALQQFLKAASVAAQQEREERQQKHLQQHQQKQQQQQQQQSSSSPSTNTASTAHLSPSSSATLTPQEQMSVRRERNRFLAKQTRERKKVQLKHLRHEFEYLAKEHAKLILLAKAHLPTETMQSLVQQSIIPRIPKQVWDDAAGVERPPEAQQHQQRAEYHPDDLSLEDTSSATSSNQAESAVETERKTVAAPAPVVEDTPTVISSSSSTSTSSSKKEAIVTPATTALNKAQDANSNKNPAKMDAAVPMEEVEAILSSLPDEDMMLSLGDEHQDQNQFDDVVEGNKNNDMMISPSADEGYGLSMDMSSSLVDPHPMSSHPSSTQEPQTLTSTTMLPLAHVVSEPDIPEMEMANMPEFSIPNPLAALGAISYEESPSATSNTSNTAPGPRLFGKPVALQSR